MTTEATQKLVTDLRVLVRDAEDLARATVAQTGDKITDLRGKVQQAASELKPRLAQAEALLEETAKTAAGSTDDFVHAQPWTAVGVAAGVGLLVGMLAARH